ncbi:MAG: leucine-rich repeat domain-containing protein [Ruminococcus sp.]|nr:leucine-rich repeat domain-containing protein [Ruminococcus sp.]
MAYSVKYTGESHQLGGSAKHFVTVYADTTSDMPTPDPAWAAGSELLISENGGQKYLLTNAGAWVKVPNFTKAAEGGDDSGQLDAMIERSITEVNSNAKSVGEYAFYKNSAVNTVDVPSATSIGSYAFYDCTGLTSVNLPSATSVETDAFKGCTSLSNVNLPSMQNVGREAFYGCTAVNTINLPSAISIGSYAFKGCTGLTSVNLPSATSVETYAFDGCTGITSVRLPAANTLGTYAFSYCENIKTADLHAAKSIGAYAFYGCKSLETLIIRTDSLCSGGSTTTLSYTKIKDGEGYVYVPAALVATYKAATIWKSISSQIRALEDYTVDGTTTGALDESKI